MIIKLSRTHTLVSRDNILNRVKDFTAHMQKLNAGQIVTSFPSQTLVIDSDHYTLIMTSDPISVGYIIIDHDEMTENA